MQDVADIFTELGGVFVSDAAVIAEKLTRIKAFIFDWDGVFNSGTKSPQAGSPFSEPDSAGLNLMRLGYWLGRDQSLPVMGIVSGENNEGAHHFALREHYNVVCTGFKNKVQAGEHICKAYGLQWNEIAFCFDDILDLSLAQRVGLRFLVRRKESPLFERHVILEGYCDYRSSASGGGFALREICELILGLTGQFKPALETRIAYGPLYETYLRAVKNVETDAIRFQPI